MFEEFVRSREVKKVSPDRALAASLVKIAELRIKNLEKTDVTEETSFSIIENCYDALKALIDALMALKGFKSYSHLACLDFLKEFYPSKISMADINVLNRYRILRNNIKYRGLLTTKEEAEQALVDLRRISAILNSLIKECKK